MHCHFKYAVIIRSFPVLEYCYKDVKYKPKLQIRRTKNCFKVTAASPERDHR